jgi:hypothetical protein
MPDSAQTSHLIQPISPRDLRDRCAGKIYALLRVAASVDREIA